MSEHSGGTAEARRHALAERLALLAETDAGFTAALHDAHRDCASARSRLDGIEAEIRRAVAERPDTPAGAAALRRFLTAKTRQIESIVAAAIADGRNRAERVRQLQAVYRPGESPSRPETG